MYNLPRQSGEGREADFARAQAPQRVELRLELAQRQAGAGGRARHHRGQRARYQLLLVLREQTLLVDDPYNKIIIKLYKFSMDFDIEIEKYINANSFVKKILISRVIYM